MTAIDPAVASSGTAAPRPSTPDKLSESPYLFHKPPERSKTEAADMRFALRLGRAVSVPVVTSDVCTVPSPRKKMPAAPLPLLPAGSAPMGIGVDVEVFDDATVSVFEVVEEEDEDVDKPVFAAPVKSHFPISHMLLCTTM